MREELRVMKNVAEMSAWVVQLLAMKFAADGHFVSGQDMLGRWYRARAFCSTCCHDLHSYQSTSYDTESCICHMRVEGLLLGWLLDQ